MISRLAVGGLSIIWQRIFLILVWQTGKQRFDSGLISLERGELLKHDSPYLAGQTIFVL